VPNRHPANGQVPRTAPTILFAHVVTQVTAEVTYLEAVRAALEDELTDDPRVVLLG